MKTISRSIIELVNERIFIEEKDYIKQLQKAINREEITPILKEVKEQGPMMENLIKRKLNALDTDEVLDVNINLEYYPSLILTSIHLADYYN